MQVLNVSDNHWITISNIGCGPGIVNVFDSIPQSSVSSCTKEQIAAILFSEEHTISLHFKQVQVQRGHADCGLFAIAFATALCSAKYPTEINFIQHQLRKHLQKCLVERDITGFPQTRKREHQERQREQTISRCTVFAGNPRGGK